MRKKNAIISVAIGLLMTIFSLGIKRSYSGDVRCYIYQGSPPPSAIKEDIPKNSYQLGFPLPYLISHGCQTVWHDNYDWGKTPQQLKILPAALDALIWSTVVYVAVMLSFSKRNGVKK